MDPADLVGSGIQPATGGRGQILWVVSKPRLWVWLPCYFGLPQYFGVYRRFLRNQPIYLGQPNGKPRCRSTETLDPYDPPMSLIQTPKDGTEYLHDAHIDTDQLILKTLGNHLELPGEGLEIDGDTELDWDNDPEIPGLAGHPKFVELTRDNTYNGESDLGLGFTYTVWGPRDTGDWLYATDILVAICNHRGGDPRGNYGGPLVYKVETPLADGFLGWVMGWHVAYSEETLERETPADPDGEYGVGYSSHPTTNLARALGDTPGEWVDGSYHGVLDGHPVTCSPYCEAEYL